MSGYVSKFPFPFPCTSSVSPPPPLYLLTHTHKGTHDFSPRENRDWARCQAKVSGEGRKNRDPLEPSCSVCLCFSFDRKSMIAWSKQKTGVMMPLCTSGSEAWTWQPQQQWWLPPRYRAGPWPPCHMSISIPLACPAHTCAPCTRQAEDHSVVPYPFGRSLENIIEKMVKIAGMRTHTMYTMLRGFQSSWNSSEGPRSISSKLLGAPASEK